MKANKGEWSELYAFLKILEDKKLFAADKNLEIILKSSMQLTVNQKCKIELRRLLITVAL